MSLTPEDLLFMNQFFPNSLESLFKTLTLSSNIFSTLTHWASLILDCIFGYELEMNE